MPTRVQRFQDFESEPVYDGIWACASLLHVQADELPDVFRRLIEGLKPGGVLYNSFKHGVDERSSEDGRFYQDMDEERLHAVLSCISGAYPAEIWLSHGEGSWSGRDAWINSIVIKSSEANRSRE